MPESDYYFKEGWCFSRIAFGNLGVRHFRRSDLFGHTNPIILFNEGVEAGARWSHAGLLNSPLVSYVLRAITQSNDFPEGYLRRLPYPRPSADLIRPARVASKTALAHAQAIVASDLREPTFRFPSEAVGEDCASSLADLVTRKLKRRLAHELVVSVCERTLQLLSYSQWMLSAADATALDKVIGGTALPIVWAGLPAAIIGRSLSWCRTRIPARLLVAWSDGLRSDSSLSSDFSCRECSREWAGQPGHCWRKKRRTAGLHPCRLAHTRLSSAGFLSQAGLRDRCSD